MTNKRLLDRSDSDATINFMPSHSHSHSRLLFDNNTTRLQKPLLIITSIIQPIFSSKFVFDLLFKDVIFVFGVEKFIIEGIKRDIVLGLSFFFF
jgi:hypothetical protein